MRNTSGIAILTAFIFLVGGVLTFPVASSAQITFSPVAVVQSLPNPALAGQTVTLDGSASFATAAGASIVLWEWDIDDDGVFDFTGPVVTVSFSALGDFPVGLRVTDNQSPPETDTTSTTIRISAPPLAPTADADGPYIFCPQTQPWFMDGTGSVNPDEGFGLPGAPGDTIIEYAWDLDGNGTFSDAFGSQADVTAFFTALGVGDYLVQLRVTDATSISFPTSGLPNLSDVGSAVVQVQAATDLECQCVVDLAARAKRGKVQLIWTHTGALSYNVYRSTTMGGPYTFIANTTSTFSTYLDTDVILGVTYYYVVREVALNTEELCQSNEAGVTPQSRTFR